MSSSDPIKPLSTYDIQALLTALKLWSLIIFPGIGFVTGFTLRMLLATIFGWSHSASFEIWITHLATMTFMIATLGDDLYNMQNPADPREKAFMLCFMYLGLFGCILGLCP